MKNLYTFSRKSWIFKFPNWVYGIDSAKTFKTFCPLFWLLILTILLIWVIIPIKLLGKRGTMFLDKLRTYQNNKEQKRKDTFVETHSRLDYTEEQAYYIVTNKCFSKYGWRLNTDFYWDIKNKAENYSLKLYTEKEKTINIRKEKVKEIKESKTFEIVSIIIVSGIILFIGYILYQWWNSFEFLPIDWKEVKFITGIVGLVIIAIIVSYLTFVYLLIPLFSKLKCMDCIICKWKIWDYVSVFFVGIAKGVVIFFSMIKATYKAYCPIITLKD